jgi:NADPH:quinone reductase-like Zn-dependent oxidoreductase
MPRAVRYDHYGPLDVLYVAEVDVPTPAADEVVVEVVSAGINPGEVPVREGLAHEIWPATFPSGQGSDFAGRVVAAGSAVSAPAVGAEVLGFTDNRAAQADYVAVPARQVTPKPANVGWDEAGPLFVAGSTAYAAVRAVAAKPGETVVVTAAAGGVGSLAVQLLLRAGARVLVVAGEANRSRLASLGAVPVVYGDGVEEQRLRAAAPDGVDAFIDAFGAGYVELAIRLGVAPVRINTVVDFPAARRFGTRSARPPRTSWPNSPRSSQQVNSPSSSPPGIPLNRSGKPMRSWPGRAPAARSSCGCADPLPGPTPGGHDARP